MVVSPVISAGAGGRVAACALPASLELGERAHAPSAAAGGADERMLVRAASIPSEASLGGLNALGASLVGVGINYN